MKKLSYAVTYAILGDGILAPESGMDELYQAMEKHLGEEVVYKNTKVTSVTRNPGKPASVHTQKEGETRVFNCNQLLVSIPPLLENLAEFDLDYREIKLFSQFKARAYWSTFLKISGLPADKVILNMNSDFPINAFRLPGIHCITPTPFESQYNVLFSANTPMSEANVKRLIKDDIERLSNYTGGAVVLEEFLAFIDHTPYGLYVDKEDISMGFYQRLLDLQGYRSTYYIGAAMDTHSTAGVWEHADDLIARHFPAKEGESGEVQRTFSNRA